MAMTIEFYSANSQALVTLFEWSLFCVADLAWEEKNEDTVSEQLKAYLVADFSFLLQVPEDLDSLCRSLSKYNSLIPSVFRDILMEQIWDDGDEIVPLESLTILSDHFAKELAGLNEDEMEHAARDWVSLFPDSEQPSAYHALWQLQEVARDAVARKQSFIFHLHRWSILI